MIMQQLRIIALITFVISLQACYQDKGNYEYHDINEISIAGMNANYSVITALDVLHIEPEIGMTENVEDPQRMEYYWIINKGTTAVDTVGREPVLDYHVDLEPGAYTLFLRIIDKKTTVAWKKGVSLNVGTLYSKGLLLIGTDEEGNAGAGMISMVTDTVLIPGLLTLSGLPVLHDPVSLVHAGDKERA